LIDPVGNSRYFSGMKVIFPLLAFLVGTVAAAEKPVVFEVSGIKFTAPVSWTSQKLASRMRAAQFRVPGAKGKVAASCVFFYFGPGAAGGVDANVNRWLGQFTPKPKVKSTVKPEKINGVAVTHVNAEGTYLDGPPFGAKVPKPGYAMRGVIVMAPRGAVFIKMTGPKAVVAAAEKPLLKMLEAALK